MAKWKVEESAKARWRESLNGAVVQHTQDVMIMGTSFFSKPDPDWSMPPHCDVREPRGDELGTESLRGFSSLCTDFPNRHDLVPGPI